MTSYYDPSQDMLGRYLPLDGTVEFFSRIKTTLRKTDIVIDLGAGRGSWYFEDKCDFRREIRDIKPHVAKFIGLDIDSAVMENPATSENYIIKDNLIPLPDSFADIIISDYVLEHVEDVPSFVSEINRVLKPGGYFIARTPHKYQYISIAARLIRNKNHINFLRFIQPKRKVEDVFPTAYRLNTLKKIKKTFNEYHNFSYLYTAEPSYFFGNIKIYTLFSLVHKFLPKIFTSNIFIFLKKK